MSQTFPHDRKQKGEEKRESLPVNSVSPTCTHTQTHTCLKHRQCCQGRIASEQDREGPEISVRAELGP